MKKTISLGVFFILTPANFHFSRICGKTENVQDFIRLENSVSVLQILL